MNNYTVTIEPSAPVFGYDKWLLNQGNPAFMLKFPSQAKYGQMSINRLVRESKSIIDGNNGDEVAIFFAPEVTKENWSPRGLYRRLTGIRFVTDEINQFHDSEWGQQMRDEQGFMCYKGVFSWLTADSVLKCLEWANGRGITDLRMEIRYIAD